LWVGLTVIAEVLVLSLDPFPISAAKEAHLIDSAFKLLMILGAPVFTFVIAMMLYSVLRFRTPGEPRDDEVPWMGGRRIPWIWFVVTSGLAVFVIFNPGLKGLAELSIPIEPDLVVEIETAQWSWTVHYPQYGLTIEQADELVLPLGRRVRFELTSIDVIHSLWVPAFRMKQDAVPGRVTSMEVTPDRIGSFADDPNMRVQCAELCGTGHQRMRMGVRVMDLEGFERWVVQQGGQEQARLEP
jgi:cytochrome c oxidase subunit 2